MTNEIAHSGVEGQKWYNRRYQYEDGTYTELGKARRRVGNNDRRYEITKAPTTKEEAARREAYYKKKEAIRSGDIVYANKHLDDFSNDELDAIVERYYKNKKISEINTQIETEGKMTPEKLANKLYTYSNIASSVGNIAVNADRVHKSLTAMKNRKKDPYYDKKGNDKKKKHKD